MGEGSALRTAIESGKPHSAILYGPPGAGKTTLARIAAAGADGRLRGGVGGQRRQSRDPRRDRAGAGAAAGQRAADDPLPRRDPPLQQGPAGRAAAGGRGRAADPDRGDHREPLLRGQLGAALARPGLRAAAARARRRWRSCCGGRSPTPSAGSPTRRRSRTRPWRCWPSAAAATPGSRSRRWSGRSSAAGGKRDRRRRGRGRAAAQGDRLRPPGRPPLRLRLGLDQGHPRLRRRRLALLPGGDAGGRRGPALHRPPHGHPRLRGHRQRRPAGAARRRRRRPRGRPRRPARVRAQPRPGLRLPRPRAEVERLLQGARGGPRRGPRATAPRPRPTTCATPTTPAPTKLGRGSGYRYAHDEPGGVATSRCCPRASRTAASTPRPTAASRPSWAAAWPSCGRRFGQVREIRGATSRSTSGFSESAFQARARESRQPGRRPGLGASGRTLHRGERASSGTGLGALRFRVRLTGRSGRADRLS